MQFNNTFEYIKLPEPLSEEEIYDCFKKYRLGDLTSRTKIIEHNIRLVISEVRRKFANTLYEENELVSIGLIGLMKSVDTFDIGKNLKFATYASKCIDNEILMFMRKGKKHINDSSLEYVIKIDNSGNELKLEDVISDTSCDLISNYEQKETYEIIRQIVEELPNREKIIIMMHFGFIDDKLYTQREIASKLKLSQSHVSRLITKIVKKIKEKLESDNIESFNKKQDKETEDVLNREHPKNTNDIINGKGEKQMSKKLQSIYEYFYNYSKEEIDLMLLKLSTDEKELIKLRYGDNLDIPVTSETWGKQQNALFYGSLVPKMRRLLSNPTGNRKAHEKSTESNNSDHKDESNVPLASKQPVTNKLNSLYGQQENISMLDSSAEINIQLFDKVRTPILDEILKKLSYRESIIACLKFGYVDNKYYSTESVAKFLEIDENEVNEIIRKILFLYKEAINNYIDQAIDIFDNKKCKIYKK